MSKYIVSARGKNPKLKIKDYINYQFSKYAGKITSVFGFAEHCKLYGGRIFIEPELSLSDIHWLYDNNIGFRIPLTGTRPSREDYLESKIFLEKYHQEGNSLIIANDSLADWIKEDFPKYKLEASAIKHISNVNSFSEALQRYHSIVLPAMINDDVLFLESIPAKEKTVLFINATCAYSCKAQICYDVASRINRKESNIPNRKCSSKNPRQSLCRVVSFDENKFKLMGFSIFKVLPARPHLPLLPEPKLKK